MSRPRQTLNLNEVDIDLAGIEQLILNKQFKLTQFAIDNNINPTELRVKLVEYLTAQGYTVSIKRGRAGGINIVKNPPSESV